MNKYLRAAAALRSDPMGTLSQMNVCLVSENGKIWSRLTHPKFTLEVRVSRGSPPQLIAPSHEPQEDRDGVVTALDEALRDASERRSGLTDLFEAYRPEDWTGICALRLLLRAGVLYGGARLPAGHRNRASGHLRLVMGETQGDRNDLRVVP
jgi:hypothetical protein